jgi:hypothetical protein
VNNIALNGSPVNAVEEVDASVQTFKIGISEKVLEDLRTRLGATRWPEGLRDSDWKDGTSEVYLKGLLQHWQHGFDWRVQEEAINAFAQFRADVDGVGIHFIHERGRGTRPLPLILTHGYPDSFLRFRKISRANQECSSGSVICGPH